MFSLDIRQKEGLHFLSWKLFFKLLKGIMKLFYLENIFPIPWKLLLQNFYFENFEYPLIRGSLLRRCPLSGGFIVIQNNFTLKSFKRIFRFISSEFSVFQQNFLELDVWNKIWMRYLIYYTDKILKGKSIKRILMFS